MSVSTMALATPSPLPTGKYSVALPAQPAPSLNDLDVFLKQQKYIKLIGRGQTALTSLAWLDRIYVLAAKKQVLFVKTGLLQTKNIELQKIYRHKRGFLIHLPQDQTRMAALFFNGHSEDLVRSLSSQMGIKLRPSKPQAWRLLFPFALAHAQEDTQACHRLQHESQVSSQNADLLQMSWGCLQGLGTGLWDSTVGIVQQIGGGIHYVVTNGVGDAWEAVNQQFGQMAYIVENFQKVLGDFGAQYEALPADMKAKLICEVITMVGLPVIYAVLSGGASTPAIGVKIAQAVQKFASLNRGLRLQKFSDDMVDFMRREQIRLESLYNLEGGRQFRHAVEVRNHALDDLNSSIRQLSEHKSHLPQKARDVPDWERRRRDLQVAVDTKRQSLREAHTAYTNAENYLHQMHADATRAALGHVGSASFTTSYLCLLQGQLSEFFDLPTAEDGAAATQ